MIADEEQVAQAFKEGIITDDDVLRHMGEEVPKANVSDGENTATVNKTEEKESKDQTAELHRRTTTTSTEDALAGALFETITKGEVPDLSPQTVLPADKTKTVVPDVGASATKPSRGPKTAARSALAQSDMKDVWPSSAMHMLSPRVLAGLGGELDHFKDGEGAIGWDHLARELF